MAPIKGELGDGDIRNLGFGVVANWAPGTAQTVFMCGSDAGNGAFTTLIAARSPTGTQPLSFTIRINGNLWGVSVSLSGLVPGLFLPVLPPSGVQAPILPGQTVTVTPLTASAGTCTFDMIGYYF